MVGHAGKTLFIQTTLDAPKRRIVAASLDQPDPAHWRVAGARGRRGDPGRGDGRRQLLVNYEVVAKSRLALFSTDGKPEGEVALPALGSVSRLSARNDSDTVYYGFTSFLYPRVRLPPRRRKRRKSGMFFKPEVRFDPSPYDLKQVFYPSKDGTQIPMFIVAKKGVKLDGSNPTILYGYGGFDITDHATLQPDAAGVARAGRRLRRRQPARRRRPTARPGTRPACWATSRTSSTTSPWARST